MMQCCVEERRSQCAPSVLALEWSVWLALVYTASCSVVVGHSRPLVGGCVVSMNDTSAELRADCLPVCYCVECLCAHCVVVMRAPESGYKVVW